jgi:hypothetical protein
MLDGHGHRDTLRWTVTAIGTCWMIPMHSPMYGPWNSWNILEKKSSS